MAPSGEAWANPLGWLMLLLGMLLAQVLGSSPALWLLLACGTLLVGAWVARFS